MDTEADWIIYTNLPWCNKTDMKFHSRYEKLLDMPWYSQNMKWFKFVDVNSPKTFHGTTKFSNVYGDMKYKFAMTNMQKNVTYILFTAMISKKKTLIDNDFKFSTVDVKKFPE